MHQQIRLAVPRSSPPSLARVLEILRDAEINLIAVGGSNVEHGGEFAFAVDHDRHEDALEALKNARLRPRTVDVQVCYLDNRPGALLECISEMNEQLRPEGRLIRDLAIGVPGDDGRVPVQIFFDRGEEETAGENATAT